jgi:hypothetical protein
MGYRRCGLLAVAAIIALAPVRSFGDTPPTDNSLPLFETLLSDPNNVAANLAYAEALQGEGRIDEATAIYRKVLSLDPNNAAAAGALNALGASVSAAHTDFTLRWGGAWESNSPRRPPGFSGNAGEVGFGEFTINDFRDIGGIPFQSNFDLYSNIHTKFPSVDISYVSADTGPVADLGTLGKLRIAAGGEYLLQGSIVNPPDGGHGTRRFTFDAGDMILNYFPPTKMALQSVNALVGYDSFTADEDFRDGWVFRMTAPFVFTEVTPYHTELIATPGFIYNGASDPFATTPRPAHYEEIDLDLLALTPLAQHELWSDSVVGKVGMFVDSQWYNSHDPSLTTGDRQDVQIIPLIGIRLLNFAGTRIEVDFDYRYDRNFSNDPSERFQDHIVTLAGTYRF